MCRSCLDDSGHGWFGMVIFCPQTRTSAEDRYWCDSLSLIGISCVASCVENAVHVTVLRHGAIKASIKLKHIHKTWNHRIIVRLKASVQWKRGWFQLVKIMLLELPFHIGKKTKWISGINETTTCKVMKSSLERYWKVVLHGNEN